MKKKITPNKFDALVDRLVSEFIKIPNFDLTATDELANKVFNIVAFRVSEVSSYRDLVCAHFIPATNKAIFESQKDFKNSKYKVFLKIQDLDFKETLYETIRLAYVGLFHKLESYINDVIKIADVIFEDFYEIDGTVTKWAKDKFEFDLKDWKQFYITNKINWICNCVKHKDGFPIKEPKPSAFEFIDETKRIRISPEEFKNDCDILLKFYPVYLQSISIFSQHKLATEKPLLKEDYELTPVFYEEQVKMRKKLDEMVNEFVNLLKTMQ